jgi:hypothetical protein
VGSFVWHVREGSFEGPELASAYRYHPFSVDEPHIGTDDVFLEGAGPWRVIDFQRTEVLESDGNILVVERAVLLLPLPAIRARRNPASDLHEVERGGSG